MYQYKFVVLIHANGEQQQKCTPTSPVNIQYPIAPKTTRQLQDSYLQMANIKNFTYFNFLDTICIIHFTRQIIQFYVSHPCNHNLHVTPLETNDLI